MEEMRAEIIALYVSITKLDELMAQGLFSTWKKKLTNDELVGWLILQMAGTGLRRVLQQSDTATQIDGDHARANYTIMNYLIDHGGLVLLEEPMMVNNKQHTVLGLEIKDLAKTKSLIKELMVLVQHIKSTGDGQGARDLVGTYGTILRNPKHMTILKENQKTIVGNLKASATLPPLFHPVTNAETGEIVDIKASWPQNIFEQQKLYAQLELSKA